MGNIAILSDNIELVYQFKDSFNQFGFDTIHLYPADRTEDFFTRVDIYDVLIFDSEIKFKYPFSLLKRASHKKSRLQILALVPSHDVDSGIKSVKFGAHQVIEKPLYKEILEEKLQIFHNGRNQPNSKEVLDKQNTVAMNKPRPLAEVEKEYILHVLEILGGNRSKTAEVLGIGRKTLYNKLCQYGVSSTQQH
jgi:DNA-binding NtrC family response regulator